MTATNTDPNYLRQCAEATTAQDLDPIVEGLRAAGISVEVEQTGGFCMVPVVRVGDRVYGIHAADLNERREVVYGIVDYSAQAWADGDLGDDELIAGYVPQTVAWIAAKVEANR